MKKSSVEVVAFTVHPRKYGRTAINSGTEENFILAL